METPLLGIGKGIECSMLMRCLRVHVHSISILNCQEIQATQMSTDG